MIHFYPERGTLIGARIIQERDGANGEPIHHARLSYGPWLRLWWLWWIQQHSNPIALKTSPPRSLTLILTEAIVSKMSTVVGFLLKIKTSFEFNFQNRQTLRLQIKSRVVRWSKFGWPHPKRPYSQCPFFYLFPSHWHTMSNLFWFSSSLFLV